MGKWGVSWATRESQELVVGTPEGAVKACEFRREGSEAERWNITDIADIEGLPWQSDPNAAGMEVEPRITAPMSVPEGIGTPSEVKPFSSRGIAVKREGCLAKGPLPGRYGHRAIVRGDEECTPRRPECRARVAEWPK